MGYANPDVQRAYQREWRARRRAEYFADKQCASCGSTEDLELDHRDPNRKVSHRIWSWSAHRRDAELAKCQVLCHPCHLAKTSGQWHLNRRQLPRPHGTKRRYDAGCKCDPCREARREYDRKRRGIPCVMTTNREKQQIGPENHDGDEQASAAAKVAQVPSGVPVNTAEPIDREAAEKAREEK